MVEKQKNMEFFSKQLYKAIKKNDLERKTNKELGLLFEVSTMTFNKWINGKMMPAMARIPHIAKVLGVSVEYLTNENINENVVLDCEKVFIQKYQNLPSNKKQIVENIVDVFSES
jgi:transcriptional regulator with XRE-family HTH domain